MCLSVPAELIAISELSSSDLSRTGKVRLGGICKEISLAYVPEAKVGDYVLVHVGFALSVIDAEEAKFVTSYIKNLEDSEPDHEF